MHVPRKEEKQKLEMLGRLMLYLSSLLVPMRKRHKEPDGEQESSSPWSENASSAKGQGSCLPAHTQKLQQEEQKQGGLARESPAAPYIIDQASAGRYMQFRVPGTPMKARGWDSWTNGCR